MIFSYNNVLEFSIGRCFESKLFIFNKLIFYIIVFCIDVNECKSFIFFMWIYLKFIIKDKFLMFYFDIRGLGRRNGFIFVVLED